MKKQAGSVVISLRPGAEVRALDKLCKQLKGALTPVFGTNAERLRREADEYRRNCGEDPPDLTRFYRMRVDRGKLGEAVERFKAADETDAVHEALLAELPTKDCRGVKASTKKPPPTTRNLRESQGYLDEPPVGIGVEAAWDLPGGRGAGVRVVHLEGAWRNTHEDLVENLLGPFNSPTSDPCWRQHGTAVLGILGADVGNSGLQGICPDAQIGMLAISDIADPDRSPEGPEVAAAIKWAVRHLVGKGDIIVLELQHSGPTNAFLPRDDRLGYIPAEWWPATFSAVKWATAQGVIVVTAAGNGGMKLDSEELDGGDVFPEWWHNPFRRAELDSGTIFVGAGAPSENAAREPGDDGTDFGPDRSRLEFSNYGDMIDAQGWGKLVTTCGYGSLQGGPSEDRWYTGRFGGTSAATPIVAGALACVQGILRAKGRAPLTPAEARKLLRETGSLQTPAANRPVSQRIGRRPDLRELIKKALA